MAALIRNPHFEISRDAGATWTKIGPVGKGPGFDALQPPLHMLLAVGLVLAVLAVNFTLIHVAPGDPAHPRGTVGGGP